jgi:AhpD family alkylhydroperoxidase
MLSLKFEAEAVMTRIASLPVEQWDNELRELAQASTLPIVQQRMLGVYANAPELAKPFLIFTGAMSQGITLRRRLLELVRLRIAFHNQCRSCMSVRYESALQDGLTEDLVCSLEKPMEAPDLTDAEKAAIHYADLAASNHLAINDETIANLRKYYTEKQIVELCMYVAYCVGFGRMAATYRIIEELPESFQDTTKTITPWGESHAEKLVIRA